jgi:hypothetical protein
MSLPPQRTAAGSLVNFPPSGVPGEVSVNGAAWAMAVIAAQNMPQRTIA